MPEPRANHCALKIQIPYVNNMTEQDHYNAVVVIGGTETRKSSSIYCGEKDDIKDNVCNKNGRDDVGWSHLKPTTVSEGWPAPAGWEVGCSIFKDNTDGVGIIVAGDGTPNAQVFMIEACTTDASRCQWTNKINGKVLKVANQNISEGRMDLLNGYPTLFTLKNKVFQFLGSSDESNLNSWIELNPTKTPYLRHATVVSVPLEFLGCSTTPPTTRSDILKAFLNESTKNSV